MPNWCDNSVRLTASKEKIDALAQVLENADDRQVFQHLRPRPADQEDNWYDWNINNWGTKWDISLIDWNREDDDTIWISFDTAWGPPIALYEYLFENDWYVDALYHEGGMAFCGQWIDGEDDYHNYDISDKQSIENLPSDVVEFAGLDSAYEDYMENIQTDILWQLPRTEYFDAKIKPLKHGRYIIKTKQSDYDHFATWDGSDWGKNWDGKKIKPTVWCGLTEELTEDKFQELVEEETSRC